MFCDAANYYISACIFNSIIYSMFYFLTDQRLTSLLAIEAFVTFVNIRFPETSLDDSNY